MLMIGRKSPTCSFSLGREREQWNVHQCAGFFGGCPREWFLSCPTQSTDEEQHSLDAWGQQRTKKEFISLWQHQRTCNTAERNGHSSLQLGESAQLWLLPWEKKRTLKCASNMLAFWRAAQGMGFCLTWLRALTEMAYFGYLGAREQNRAQWLVAVPETLQCHRQTPEGSRDKKLLKKKLVNLSNWEIPCTSPAIAKAQRLHFPRKYLRGSPNL